MIEALHFGSMLPAALGACCVAATDDRRSTGAWAGMLLMLTAMADTMLLPSSVLPALAWFGVLLVAAIATVARGRFRAAGARAPHPMTLHRSLQLLLTAALIAVAGHHATASVGAHEHPVSVVGGVAVATALFVAFSAWIAFRGRAAVVSRTDSGTGSSAVAGSGAVAIAASGAVAVSGWRWQRLEAALGGLATVAMALGTLLHA